MREQLFAQAYPTACRAARVRTAAAVAQAVILSAEREDIEQEILTAVWQRLASYDPKRSSLRTFVELIVASTLASALRSRRKQRGLDGLANDRARNVNTGLVALECWVDIRAAAVPLTNRDRRIAVLLMEYSAADVGRLLGLSRSTVYAGISRIRIAFKEAGLGPRARCTEGHDLRAPSIRPAPDLTVHSR
jgi:RNA polymerase sigma factor (sigma-70 family)